MRRILAFLLLAALMLSLAACGKQTDKSAYDTKYLGYDKQYYALGGIVVKDDCVYLLAFDQTPSGEGKIVIATLDESGKTINSFSYESRQFAPMEQGWTGQNNVLELAVDSAHNIWLLEEHYSFRMPSAGEDGAGDFRHEFALTKVDARGNVLLSTDINALFEGKDGFALRKQLLCDKEGNVYLLLSEGKYGSLQVYDGDGQPLYAPAEKISAVAVTENGTVMAVVQNEPSNGSVSLRAVEAGAGRLGEKRGLEVGCSYLYGGLGDALLINDSQKLYSYDTETGETSVVFDWFDIDIVNSNTKYFGALPDGRYVLLGSGIYSDAPDIIMLEAVPASSLQEKTVLTLATGYATPAQKAAAVQFGRANPDYKIKIVEYCDVNVPDTTSLDRFYVDINAGNVPDMVDFDYFDARRLIRAGVMEDLYPYLDSDLELRRSDLLPNLLEAIETGGCLYYLPRSFYLRVIAGDADVVGDGTVWNMQKLYEVAENHKEFEYIMGSLCGQSEFMKLAMEFNMNTFVDFENQSCNFEKSEFYELLNFAKTTFPADGDASVFNLAYQQFAPIMEGEQMLYCGNVSMASDIMLIDELFGGNASFVGFPSEDGNGNIFVPESSMGITKASKHKEIAWEFCVGSIRKNHIASVRTRFSPRISTRSVPCSENRK